MSRHRGLHRFRGVFLAIRSYRAIRAVQRAHMGHLDGAPDPWCPECALVVFLPPVGVEELTEEDI